MPTSISSILKNKYLLWALLALPSWQYLSEFISPDRYYPEMMKNSGILSIQLLVFSLCITPISFILKKINVLKPLALWLIRSRRYFGLAGFGYAAIHTALYVRQIFDIELIWLEAFIWSLGTGWISLFILLILALTSNNWSVKTLGKYWKHLQRLSYLAIIAGFAHWILLDFFIDNALVWIIPLVIAKLVHIGFRVYGSGRNEKSQTSLTIT